MISVPIKKLFPSAKRISCGEIRQGDFIAYLDREGGFDINEGLCHAVVQDESGRWWNDGYYWGVPDDPKIMLYRVGKNSNDW